MLLLTLKIFKDSPNLKEICKLYNIFYKVLFWSEVLSIWLLFFYYLFKIAFPILVTINDNIPPYPQFLFWWFQLSTVQHYLEANDSSSDVSSKKSTNSSLESLTYRE